MRAPLVLAAALLLQATPARANQPVYTGPDQDGARAAMHTYFEGEKLGGWILVAMGAAGLGSGGVLYTQDSAIARGADYPLLGVGAVHVIAGIFVNLASRRRLGRFDDQIGRGNVERFVGEESRRIADVRTQFFLLKLAEIALIAGGAGMVIIGEHQGHPRLTGAGIGLAAEAAATLVFDIVAARRAARYQRRLEPGVLSHVATGAPLPALTYRFTF